MVVTEDFKVVLLGETSTGKTCLMKRYFKNQYNEGESTTIGAFFDSKIFNVDGKEFRMGVWDTAGEEKYRAINSLYFRNAAAALVCYDVCQRRTFQQLGYWISELKKIVPNCQIYICANKCDLLQQYQPNPPLSYVESYAELNNTKFFLTSSKTRYNIEELFNEILEDFVSNFPSTPENSETIKLPSPRKHKKMRTKKCCSNR